MKKTTWGSIVGSLIVLVFLIGIGAELADPSHIPLVTAASVITNICWVAFGVFLVFSSIQARKLEDQGSVVQNSSLDHRRNRILAYVLTLEIIYSINTWILADYRAGITLINTSVIFDVIVNVFFLYFLLRLFKDKDVLRELLWVVILYGIGGIVFGVLRHDVSAAIASVLFTLYFVYVIKAPLTLHNHRIGHFVVLPAVLVLTVVAVQIEGVKLGKMLKDEIRLEQEYTNASEDVGYAYYVPFEKKSVSSGDIKTIQDKLAIRDGKAEELIPLLDKIKSKYLMQNISEQQIIELETIDLTLAMLKVYKSQEDAIRQLLVYYETIKGKSWGINEQAKIHEFDLKIQEYNNQVRDLALEFSSR